MELWGALPLVFLYYVYGWNTVSLIRSYSKAAIVRDYEPLSKLLEALLVVGAIWIVLGSSTAENSELIASLLWVHQYISFVIVAMIRSKDRVTLAVNLSYSDPIEYKQRVRLPMKLRLIVSITMEIAAIAGLSYLAFG